MANSEAAIHAQDLKREFGPVRALDGLSLDVPRGTIFGFLGPNGSGKTTTIHILLGLLEPTSGRAEVLGFDTAARSHEIRARSGALLEHHGLYENMSAEENLEFYARVCRMTAEERRNRVKEVLGQMGFSERRKDRVVNWSKGMKQKLALARALLHRPSILFLDEPTAGLDVVSASALRSDLAGLAGQEGITIFLTTHNMAEAEKLCNQVAVIRHGRLITVGNPDELRAQGGSPKVEIEGSGFSPGLLERLNALPEVSAAEIVGKNLSISLRDAADVAPLVSLIVSSGARVEEVRKGKASLEEVFLTLMEEEK